MSLATRCSACGTVFRVVKDQLLVSDGWVRCGRCQQVFNALEGLFDLERDGAPPPRSPNPPSEAVRRVLEELSRLGPVEAAARPAVADPEISAIAGPVAGPIAGPIAEPRLNPAETPASPPEPAPADTPALQPEPAADATNVSALADPAGSAEGVVVAASLAAALSAADVAGPPPPPPPPSIAAEGGHPAPPITVRPEPVITADEPPPRFVKAADRAAYWRRPGVRAALVVLLTVLALTLTAQAAWFWRDPLAARWPEARPWLEAACAPLNCRVQPLARIEHLSVESSALTRIEGTALHRLGVTLRNRGPMALRAPAIELTLTDQSGAVVARRVLTLADFGLGTVRLEAGQELALAATLAAAPGGERRVGGYTVELFYP